MTVVDASIIVRLLQNRSGDEPLRERIGRHRHLHAPTLIDAELTSAIRGLLRATRPAIHVSVKRAGEMLEDYAALPLVRHPMQPYQRRVLSLRANFTAYDAFYVALAEALQAPLLTDDHKFERSPAHAATVETWH